MPGIVFRVDVEKEFPILSSKHVAAKTADREAEWIWLKQSNNINDLNAHIWDEWADADGGIGESYGFQAGKPVDIYLDTRNRTPENFRHYDNQIEFVTEYLREVPNGRWAVITLWSVESLSKMNLIPCCHTSTWNLDGGRLNCVLDQRSGDMPYGVPFNTTQYAELMCKIARDLGVMPGILTHVIADAHIYANQMFGVKTQLAQYDLMLYMAELPIEQLIDAETTLRLIPVTAACNVLNRAKIAHELFIKNKELSKLPVTESDTVMDRVQRAIDSLRSTPVFEINTVETSIKKYTAEECRVVDYQDMGDIKFGKIVA